MIAISIANSVGRRTGGIPVPVVPIATAATGVTENSFVANWDAFSGAVYYLLDVSLDPSFSSFVGVYENYLVSGTSQLVSGLTPLTTYYYRVRAAINLDADVTSFFSRVFTAGGTLTYTEATSTEQLVSDLKSYGLWTPMKAIYPMVGASAAACAQNLVSSSFTGTFTSGWTFASTGVTPNGTSAYFNTMFNPNTQLSSNNGHLSYYSRTNDNIGSYPVEMGSESSVTTGVNLCVLMPLDNYKGRIGGNTFLSYANTNSSGFYIVSRTSSTNLIGHKNGVNQQTVSSTNTYAASNFNIYIGATNNSNTSQLFSTRQSAFASIGDGLTDTQASNFYTAVQQFQASLRRLVVSDSDAQAFLNRVYTAGGTVSVTEANAVNQMVIDLKAAGLWTKMLAIYPMVGASAAACAQNLKSASYTGSFTSGWTYSSNGVQGNGLNAYMITGFDPSVDFASFNNGASLYSRSDVSDTSYDYGITNSGGVGHNVYLNYNGVGMRWHLQCTFGQRPTYVPSGNDSTGFFTGVTGASNDRRMYKYGSLLASDTQTSTTTLAQLNTVMILGGQRNNGNPQNFSSRQYGLFAFHQNLNGSEALSLNSINTSFQVSLSRYVGLPVVSDADAQAYINRVYVAGGSLTTTEANAVNQLTIDMKAAGIWTAMKAVYPMVGSSAAACAQNLKSSSFTGTFTSGWTFASTGVQGNGTSAYMSTGLNPSTALTNNNLHIAYYSRTNVNEAKQDFNASNSTPATNEIFTTMYLNTLYFTSNIFSPNTVSTSVANTLGFVIGNTTASNVRNIWKGGIKLATDTSVNTTALPNITANLGARANPLQEYSTKEFAFASIGDGLNDTQAADFYTCVQTFNTTLSRQV